VKQVVVLAMRIATHYKGYTYTIHYTLYLAMRIATHPHMP
jgi:hypothetical protein